MASDSPPIPPINVRGPRVAPVTPAVMVRIVSLPQGLEEALQNNPTSMKLEGQIERRNDQGSTILKTGHGEMEIILKDQRHFPNGSSLILEIPAGRQAHLATILSQSPNPLPSQSPPSATENLPTQNQAQNQAQLKPQADTQNLASPAITLGRGGMLQSHMMESFLLYNLGAGEGGIGGANGGAHTVGNAVGAMGAPNALSALLHLTPLNASQIQGFLGSMGGDYAAPTVGNFLAQLLAALTQSGSNQSSTAQGANSSLTHSAANFFLQFLSNPNQSVPSMTMAGAGAGMTGMGADLLPPNLLTQIQKFLGPFESPRSGPPIGSESGAGYQGAPAPLTAQVLGSSSASASSSAPGFAASNFAVATGPIFLSQFAGFSSDHTAIFALLNGLNLTGGVQFYALQNSGYAASILNHIHRDPGQLFLLGAQGSLASLDNPSGGNLGRPQLWSNEFGPAWTTLAQIFDLLGGDENSATNPIAAQAAQTHAAQLYNLFPSPAHPHHLPILAMLMLAVARSGDIEGFLPEPILETLRQTSKGKALLDRLSLDISQFARIDQNFLPTDWKGMVIPFSWQNQIFKVPIYFKDGSTEDDNEQDLERQRKRQLRFLFDLQLSRMGGVQVDGFLQSQRLDLILRTKTALSPLMQQDMRKLYAGAVEKSHLVGDISFQSRADQWVDFSAPQASENHLGVSV
ncbi:MAG: hypothetical protein JNK24_02950 [Alphaproteobacteria bacterium]|nr:hypothetical protein [Alphaproteobacteria bacterium]